METKAGSAIETRTGNLVDLNKEILYKLAHTDRKFTKNQIREIEIEKVIEKVEVVRLTLREASHVVLGLARLVSKKMRILLEDCNAVLQLLTRDAPVKRHRVPSSRNITLAVEDGLAFIRDEQLALPEEEAIAELECSILNDMTGNPLFEVDFGDAPSIEQVRDSTLLSTTGFVPEGLAAEPKRRRIVQDSAIEIPEGTFRANIRSTAGITGQEDTGRLELEPLIRIDPRVNEMFRSEAVEEQRREMQFQEQPEFEMEFPEVPVQEIDREEEQSEKIHVEGPLLDISRLPSSFSFGFVVQELSVQDRAAGFVELLVMAGKGILRVSQSSEFTSIECMVVN